MQVKVAIELLRNRNVRTALLVAAFLVVSLPVLVAAAVVGLFAHEAEVACRGAGAPGVVDTPAGGGPIAAGLYAAPLRTAAGPLVRSRRDRVRRAGRLRAPATTARSPTPASPTCRRTRTASPSYRCSTQTRRQRRHVHVRRRRRPGQPPLPHRTAGHARGRRGDPGQARRRLRTGAGPVDRQRAALPAGRVVAGGQCARRSARARCRCSSRRAPAPARHWKRCLDPAKPRRRSPAASACAAAEGAGSVPLPLTAGTQTKILPSGLAAAGEEAPAQVKAMVAAGNRLFGTSYLYGGAHGTPLSQLEPAYDCSSAVSYVLHAGGVFRANTPRTRPNLSPTATPAPAGTSRSTPTRRTPSCTSAACASTPLKRPNTTAARTQASPVLAGASPPAVPDWATLDRPSPTGAMSERERSKRLAAGARVLAAVALAGCTQPRRADAEHERDGELVAAERRRAACAATAVRERAGAARASRRRLRRRIAAFAELYVNWTYRTLTAHQRTLAAMSVGAARLSEQPGRCEQPRPTRRSRAGASTTAARSSASPPTSPARIRG